MNFGPRFLGAYARCAELYVSHHVGVCAAVCSCVDVSRGPCVGCLSFACMCGGRHVRTRKRHLQMLAVLAGECVARGAKGGERLKERGGKGAKDGSSTPSSRGSSRGGSCVFSCSSSGCLSGIGEQKFFGMFGAGIGQAEGELLEGVRYFVTILEFDLSIMFRVFICVNVCVRVCVCARAYIYIHIHIHTYIEFDLSTMFRVFICVNV